MITQRLIQVLRTILLCKMFHMKETHDQRLMLLQPTMTVPKGETTTTLLMVTQKSFRKNVYDDGKRTFIVMNNPINSSYLPVLQEISSESFLFFGEDKTNTINFTYFDNTFVVDGIYSHLRLISKNGEEKQSADVVRLES